MGEIMQYNKNEFNGYFKNYLDINKQIDNTQKTIDELLHDDKLNKTIDFYNNLNDNNKKIFDDINCNMGFVRYKLNKKLLEELEKELDNLYYSFIDSDAFPFSKDNVHFFVSDGSSLIDAINDEDSKDLSKEENMFLNNTITSVYGYNPTDYTKDDIPLIKVVYLRERTEYKKAESPLDIDYYLLADDMLYDIELAKRIDNGEYTDDEKMCSYFKEWKIKHLKEKLLIQQQRIIESDAKTKDMLLFFITTAFYEIELQSGVSVNEIYDRLNNMEVKNEHQRRKVEREKDALINAYNNLTNQNFRKNSGYYIGNHYVFARYETANPEINKRLLKMMKR